MERSWTSASSSKSRTLHPRSASRVSPTQHAELPAYDKEMTDSRPPSEELIRHLSRYDLSVGELALALRERCSLVTLSSLGSCLSQKLTILTRQRSWPAVVNRREP